MIREPKIGDEVVCVREETYSWANKEDSGKIIEINDIEVRVVWCENGERVWYSYPGRSAYINYAPKKSTTDKIEEIKEDILAKLDRL